MDRLRSNVIGMSHSISSCRLCSHGGWLAMSGDMALANVFARAGLFNGRIIEQVQCDQHRKWRVMVLDAVLLLATIPRYCRQLVTWRTWRLHNEVDGIVPSDFGQRQTQPAL
mmetsp:Transcript_22571/g.53360  ORF Transcript_22571/g.53360 Transcript_22571/m.53360 type:complete len:112 (+) Transcript_22571:296-631(+)